jgi:hypothetical protein
LRVLFELEQAEQATGVALQQAYHRRRAKAKVIV